MLREIESHHGILVKRAERVYSFAQLTFQEHFTAKYICQTHQEKTFLLRNLLLPDWREVIVLIPGILVDATEYIRILLDQIMAEEWKFLDWTYCYLFRLVYDIAKMEMTLDRDVRSRLERFHTSEKFNDVVLVHPMGAKTRIRQEVGLALTDRMTGYGSDTDMMFPIQYLISQRGKRFKKRHIEVHNPEGEVVRLREYLDSLLAHNLLYFNPIIAFRTHIQRKRTRLELVSPSVAFKQLRKMRPTVENVVFHYLEGEEVFLL